MLPEWVIPVAVLVGVVFLWLLVFPRLKGGG